MDRDSQDARFARIAADLLKPPVPAAGAPAFGDRRRATAAIAAALHQRARQRSRRRQTIAAAAAVALLAGGVAFLAARRPAAMVVAVEGGGVLQTGQVVTAPAGGSVGLSVSTGTRLHLHGGSRLGLEEQGQNQRFALQAGRLWATVSPLRPGQRFVVATADAEVEVRGTSFEVAVVPARRECQGATTEVRVFEGLVQVRRNGRTWRVGPGQVWPADCAPMEAIAPRGAPVPVPAAPPSPRPRTRGSAPAARSPSLAAAPAAATARPAPADPASTLAEQNDLFAGAVAARRRGDLQEARRKLDDLLTRFPAGALAESARGERARLPPPGPTGQAR